jgi:predicted ATPase
MSMIAVSGAQGQGKSTVLSSLQGMGHKVVPQKTSRSILNRWGMTLAEVNAYAPLTARFQDEVVKVHEQNMRENDRPGEFVFQERSLADIFTYALNILGPFNQFDLYMQNYFLTCKELQSRYACVIYLSGRQDLTPEDDGVRSINPYFTRMIDIMIKHHIEKFDTGNVLYVDTPNHDLRVEMIDNHLRRLRDREIV